MLIFIIKIPEGFCVSQDNKLLHIISNETKMSIDSIGIVTPSIYASLFTEFANKHGQTLEDEETISSELMQKECAQLGHLQSQTSTKAIELSDNTAKAIDAIEKKDDTVLKQVLKETKQLRAEIEKLKESVYKDELTQAFNRKWMQDTYLENKDNSFKEDGVCVMIDINYFKQVNDIHGHVIGDKVLLFLTNELKKSRHSVIRYGGDEFIIIFNAQISQDSALKTLNNIRENILKKKLKAQDTTFHVSFSIGATQFKKGDIFSEVLELADKNMYEDKCQIKKRVKGI